MSARKAYVIPNPFFRGSHIFIVFIIMVIFIISFSEPCKSKIECLTSKTSCPCNVDLLLHMDDDEFISLLSKKAFDYFWQKTNPINGLIAHCSHPASPCSIASVGMGLAPIPVGVERGWISKEEGYNSALITLKTLDSDKVQKINGFLYQFIDINEGTRHENCKIASMDTCILIAGALLVGEYFQGTYVQTLTNKLYSNVNWQWMLADGKTLAKFWTPESGFEKDRWDSFNESILMYIFAIGSPTYPIPVSTWHQITRPVRSNYIFISEESLISYTLPHIWLNLKGKEDFYSNYWANTILAIRYNRIFSVLRNLKMHGSPVDFWGLSICEDPGGYRIHGASEMYYYGVLSPHAVISCIPFAPDESLKSLREVLRQYKGLVWKEYGFTSGYSITDRWVSNNYYSILQGIQLLAIENYRTGLVWKYISCNDRIKHSLDSIGFFKSRTHQAITPAYFNMIKDMHYLWDF